MTKRNSTKPKTLCIDLRWIDSSGVGMYIKGIVPGIVDHMSEMSTIGLCTPGHLAGALGMSCVILSIAAEETDPDEPSAPERVRPMGGASCVAAQSEPSRPALATAEFGN